MLILLRMIVSCTCWCHTWFCRCNMWLCCVWLCLHAIVRRTCWCHMILSCVVVLHAVVCLTCWRRMWFCCVAHIHDTIRRCNITSHMIVIWNTMVSEVMLQHLIVSYVIVSHVGGACNFIVSHMCTTQLCVATLPLTDFVWNTIVSGVILQHMIVSYVIVSQSFITYSGWLVKYLPLTCNVYEFVNGYCQRARRSSSHMTAID